VVFCPLQNIGFLEGAHPIAAELTGRVVFVLYSSYCLEVHLLAKIEAEARAERDGLEPEAPGQALERKVGDEAQLAALQRVALLA